MSMDIDEDITERVINYTRVLYKLACEINRKRCGYEVAESKIRRRI